MRTRTYDAISTSRSRRALQHMLGLHKFYISILEQQHLTACKISEQTCKGKYKLGKIDCKTKKKL